MLSPNSFVLNAGGDEVVSNEQFTVNVNGIYIQATLPAVTTAGDVLTIGFGGSIIATGYYLELIEPNTVKFEYAWNDGGEDSGEIVISTNLYNPGDIASLYYDGTQMHFYLGGILQASSSESILGLHVFRCQYNNATASETYQFNNVAIFVAGLKGQPGSMPINIQYGSGTTDEELFTSIITFPTEFTSTPNVTASIVDGSQTIITLSSINETNFTASTWNISGGVSATFNWQAML